MVGLGGEPLSSRQIKRGDQTHKCFAVVDNASLNTKMEKACPESSSSAMKAGARHELVQFKTSNHRLAEMMVILTGETVSPSKKSLSFGTVDQFKTMHQLTAPSAGSILS